MSDHPFFRCVALVGAVLARESRKSHARADLQVWRNRRVNSDGLYAEERGPWTKEG